MQLAERLRAPHYSKIWRLFDRKSPERIAAGSVVKVNYRLSAVNRTQCTFNGVILAIDRSPGCPRILVRGEIDGYAVEQSFPLTSPLLSSVEIVKSATFLGRSRLYWLRDKPSHASIFVQTREQLAKFLARRKEIKQILKTRPRPRKNTPRKPIIWSADEALSAKKKSLKSAK